MDFSLFRHETQYRLNTLVEPFGALFANDPAQKPLKGCLILEDQEIESYAPKTMKLARAFDSEVLVRDAQDRVVMPDATAPAWQSSVFRPFRGSLPWVCDPRQGPMKGLS